jgi:hypothetical protein
MAAKKPIPQPRGEKGAPAALAAIAEHELRCRTEKDAAYDAWNKAKDKLVEGDDVSERALNRAHREYLEVLEIWHDASKKLLEFEKAVPEAKRDGEKIAVSEAKEYFRQYALSIDLAVEQLVIQISQAAALCESPEEFHKAYAENIRSAKSGAVESAVAENKLPGWLLE